VTKSITIGVVSDTHGLLRSEVVEALQGSDFILHAGDVGDLEILDKLNLIAPVTAVRGNIDHGPWAQAIPETNVLEAGGLSIYMLHKLEDLDLKPQSAGFSAVIYGHSHKPAREYKNGVLFFNPGSAGPRRFHLPISIGFLTIENGAIRAELKTLQI
jgi:putative phosphoesterase